MLARLRMKLSCDDITYRNTSLLHGALFEHISSEYAEYLHAQSMHPYSQYIHKSEGNTYWVIQTLDSKAYENIIIPLMDGGFDGFHIDSLDKDVAILSKQMESVKKQQLTRDFYDGDAEDSYNLKFITATAFRQHGRYNILPDLRLFFQSLMNRYSLTSERIDMFDEDALNQLTDRTFISRHNIRSVVFPVEGIVIPGFIGDVTITVRGQDTIKRYVRFLLKFAEYSGAGVKTSMGMGALRIATERTNEGR